MDILEIELKETMSREEAAARLRAFADTLPDEIQVKVELEIESDENELEIELTW